MKGNFLWKGFGSCVIDAKRFVIVHGVTLNGGVSKFLIKYQLYVAGCI